MKYMAAFFVCLAMLITVALAVVKPPQKLVFETRMGNVTYDHAAHLKRANYKCNTCHTKLFPQSRAPREKASSAGRACGGRRCHGGE